MDGRPDPEQILKKNFPKGSGNGHGRLKIFFGYAAGVGKTYAMLEAARDEAAVGRDVLAGISSPTTGRRPWPCSPGWKCCRPGGSNTGESSCGNLTWTAF